MIRKLRKLTILLAALGVLVASTALAKPPSKRTPQESLDQMAPAPGTFDTTRVYSGSGTDSLWFGGWVNWHTGEVSGSDVTVLPLTYDPILAASFGISVIGDSLITWASSRGAANTIPRFSLELFPVVAGASWGYPERCVGVAITRTAAATVHVRAGLGGMPVDSGP